MSINLIILILPFLWFIMLKYRYKRFKYKKKIIYSILKELSKNNKNIKSSDYGIEQNEFVSILETLQSEVDIKGLENTKPAGSKSGINGRKKRMIFWTDVVITPDGIQYVKDNSSLFKLYKGLKEVKEWLTLK